MGYDPMARILYRNRPPSRLDLTWWSRIGATAQRQVIPIADEALKTCVITDLALSHRGGATARMAHPAAAAERTCHAPWYCQRLSGRHNGDPERPAA